MVLRRRSMKRRRPMDVLLGNGWRRFALQA